MVRIQWEDPPETQPYSRVAAGNPRYHELKQIANVLRKKPHTWAMIHLASSARGAHSMAYFIRNGRYVSFGDDFDAKAVASEGEYRVYARYVGNEPLPNDDAPDNSSNDSGDAETVMWVPEDVTTEWEIR